MPNIKFSYLYRDAGNYKNFGYVILANPTNRALADIEHYLNRNLIDGCWFYAEAWQLPNLRPLHTTQNDPTWHEFENVEYTDLPVNALLSLEQLLGSVHPPSSR